MTLREIAASQAEYRERFGIDPNAILLDLNSTTEISEIMESYGTLKAARQAGARAKILMGLQVIQADIDGFMVARVL